MSAFRHHLLSLIPLTLVAACAGSKMASQSVTAAPGGGGEPAAPYTGMATGDYAPPASHTSVQAPSSGIAMDPPAPAPIDERPGLATAWGESVWSPITTSPFVRASAQPWATVVVHYNDEDGVRAHAAYLGGALAPLEAPIGDGSLGISLVGDGGELLPGVAVAGRNLVVGHDGERYRIVIRNATSARFEVVASVDGLDVIDGKPAAPERRGYLVDPHGELVIDGFRQSDDQVASFRFGSVASSYAAQTAGDANVGVIGVAVFAEKGSVWTPAELGRRDQADPFPARGYATPPR